MSMTLSVTSFRRMRRLLKHASAEMRRVTSQPMPIPQDDTSSSSSMDLKSSRGFAYQPFDWSNDSQQTELSLSNELIQGMESIVTCRQRIFAALAEILNDDPRQRRFTPPLLPMLSFFKLLIHSYTCYFFQLKRSLF